MSVESRLRDPLHRRILEALDAGPDPHLFERCVGDLLQDSFPSLVPVSGGSDRGMDGAIADGEGEAYPLVCTTGADPEGNLRNSLSSQLQKRWPRKKAVFATSRSLTPATRRKLEGIARDLDFVLVQVIDRDGIADRLYRSSHWRKELGIVGSASALSVVPRSSRPQLTSTLVGRDHDLEWLQGSSGDRILSGQPGSGKTELLRHLVDQNWGLFLVGESRSEIKDALLDQRLDQASDFAVVVDDAHRRTDHLLTLLQLREDLSATFPIVATCWPGALSEIQSILGLGSRMTWDLEGLTRREILEVYAGAGVTKEAVEARFVTPSEVILRGLVDVACNKPGLAVTFASIWLRGDYEEIFTGAGLKREMEVFERLVGQGALRVLACFAAGGQAGMMKEGVAEFLEVPVSRIRDLVVGLEEGGALSERPDRALAVEPRVLRSALLQEVFFQGRARDLGIQELVKRALDIRSALEAILWSKEAGAVVDEDWVRSLVASNGSPQLWKLYMSLGAEQTRWVLRSYPGNFMEVAEEALFHTPEVVIPTLIEEASGWKQDPIAASNHPLNLLKAWIGELDPRCDSLERRRQLAHVAMEFLRQKKFEAMALQALLLAMSPNLSRSTRDPGFGNRVTTYSAHLDLEAVERLTDLWRQAVPHIPEIRPQWLAALHNSLWPWMHPGDGGQFELSESVRTRMLEHARQMLSDLAVHSGQSIAVRADLERLSRDLGKPLGLSLDKEYEILFPDRPRGPMGEVSWKGARRQEEEAAEALALSWMKKKREFVAGRLEELLAEAKEAGHASRSRVPDLVRSISGRVKSTASWAAAFSDAGLPEHLFAPFLRRAAENDEDGWSLVAERALKNSDSSGAVFLLVMSLESPPKLLREIAIERAEQFLFRFQQLRQDDSEDSMRRLLRHGNSRVAATAAEAEWLASAVEPKRPRLGLLEDWRCAVLGYRPDESQCNDFYWLCQILAMNSDLAILWLQERIKDGLPGLPVNDTPYESAVGTLDQDQRLILLTKLDPVAETDGCRDLIIALVGDDPVVFAALLDRNSLRRHHLRPLAVKSSAALNDQWAQMATLAHRAAHEGKEIVYNTVYGSGSVFIAGSGVPFWQGWRDGFARFEDDPQKEVREVAASGIALAESMLTRANSEQRQRELKGI